MTSSGILLFAYSTNNIDYLKIAEYCANNAKKWLNLPVTLITDIDNSSKSFDHVILVPNKKSSERNFQDKKQTSKWRNFGRSRAYELSPYDQTLLLDVDYIISSNQLTKIMQSSQEFLCYDSAIECSGTKGSNKQFGKTHMPMFWATVIMFKKTKKCEMIFDIMKIIEENYSHYADLFGFSKTPFRNDYALSIALSIVSGHLVTKEHSIPWPMVNVNPEHKISRIDNNKFQVLYRKSMRGRERTCRNMFLNQDLHIMGKSDLERIVEADR